MSLKQKVNLCIIIVCIIFGLSFFFFILRFETVLQTRIGSELHDLTEGAMDAIDRSLFLRIEEVELQLLDMSTDRLFEQSNQKYASMSDREGFITKVNEAWENGLDTPEIRSILLNPLSREFENKIQFLNNKFKFYVFSEIFAVNRYGVVMGAYPRTADFYQADEAWYQRAVQSQSGLSFGDVHYDKNANAHILTISKKTTDDKGRFDGLVRAELNVKLFEEILDDVRKKSELKSLKYFLLNKNGETLVLGANGLAPKSASLAGSFGEKFPYWEKVQEALKTGRPFIYGDTRYGPSLTAFASSDGWQDFKGLGWNLVLMVDREEVLAPVSDLKTQLVGGLLLLALILAVSSGAFMRYTLRPIEHLTRQAEAISRGNWDIGLAVNSNDEVGQLARSFNRMATVIKKNQDELEEQVIEHTRRAFQAEKQAKEAKQMDDAKSLFLVNMSHEIRTPLNAILGYSQILRRGTNLTDDQIEKINMVYRSGDHLLALINDILDVSKIEARKENLDRHEFNLSHLINQLAEVTRVDCQQKDIQFRLEAFPLDEERWVWGDEGKIRRVLVKLLSNATKFTDRGGVLFRVTPKANEEFLFEIIDTGPGIPKEEYAFIFEPFHQGQAGRKKDGTGMGLTIAKRLVEIMDGQLKFETKLGKGTRFYFSLILLHAERKVNVDMMLEDMETQMAGSPLIQALLVDDNTANLDILKELISTLGAEVQMAEGGEEGLKLIESWKPDIIFLDQHMPGMTGSEMMKRIHDKYGKERFKIVMTTASTLTHQTKEFLKEGADAVLRKPVVYEELLTITRNLLKDKFAVEKPGPGTAPAKATKEAFPVKLDYQAITLPHALWSKLEYSARMGLFLDFEKHLSKLKGLGPKEAELADRLYKLSRLFESKKIQDILNKVRHDE
ncbi:hybrid sensor histidine kinase/response regulator [Nitrospina gracilis]|uniref:hybrid sensor histidine kinase/response regulator n=1 Tax=Nitrospina gracilis TaxID=35801 RepID=UPI001F29A0B9|nr:hybrid sensor histidine kinase/response regulator [Nitrospina gracilis]MCF8720930.1 signal transduction histidine kinase/ActR/RegA family two-component response regulator [Nitrospina gracilis Nb-211]